MFGLFKKKSKCEHEWYKTLERKEGYTILIGGVVDTKYEDVVYAYCPKCKTRKGFLKNEWELIEKEQEIKNKYIAKSQ